MTDDKMIYFLTGMSIGLVMGLTLGIAIVKLFPDNQPIQISRTESGYLLSKV